MSEETVTFNVVYNVQGINESIRGTQRYLFFMNALRLSAQDIQQVMSGPTLQNVLWTTIQLTRAWTAFHRIVKATNQEQAKGVAGGVLRSTVDAARRRAISAVGAPMGFGATTTTQTTTIGFFTNLAATLGVPLALLGGSAGTVIATAGVLYLDRRRTIRHNDWRKRQRDIARSQGLEF